MSVLLAFVVINWTNFNDFELHDATFMDHSKAFDCVNYDILVAK